ncbi:MAG TPA: lysophospholipid acyltransferase family protein [Phycisphaerales bacterium]|nr:lysophospholipid acyltransferase family protein [Phycisphaerales bacterium]HMP38682.1 lysophospholipid acyltransferase family protein [Phycisphaerales bacterium]
MPAGPESAAEETFIALPTSAPTLTAIVIAALLWCGACLGWRFFALPWLRRQCGDDAVAGAMTAVVRVYARLFHRLRCRGAEALRDSVDPGALIVVANHGAGIDPLLIQSAFRGHIRWMMARDMMVPALRWLWDRERMIPVDFDRSDTAAVRDAIRHVREGGVLGVFPEGGLARPPERLMPFMPGVGLIVTRTGAPVALCAVRGTPKRDRAFESLIVPSRSSVDVIDVIRYSERERPEAIVADLRRRLAEATGWPMVEGDEQGRG